MNIILIGAGKVGQTIIKVLAKEHHSLTVVDSSPKVIEDISEKYDVAAILGSGSSLDVLRTAGIDKADALIATTESDEINILACLIAAQFGVSGKVARVRDIEYAAQNQWMKDKFDIDLIINPEFETSNEIKNILNFPEAQRVESLARGKADLVEIFIKEGNPLIGMSLQQIHNEYDVQILVCAVERNQQVIIPNGNFTIKANDLIYLTATRMMIKTFLKALDLVESRIKDVLIIGGGKIAVYLASDLAKNKFNVKIIEQNLDRCNELADILPNVDIICGNGSDQTVLDEEGLDYMDAVVCLTGMDEENVILSLYAEKNMKGKIITKVNQETYNNLIPKSDRLTVVSPKEITASRIISYIRGLKSKFNNNMGNFYSIVDGQVEVLEFSVAEGDSIIGKPLKNLHFRKGILLSTIIRGEDVIIPGGRDEIMAGDVVVIVSQNNTIIKLDDVLE